MQLLKENGVEPQIVDYLKNPLSAGTLKLLSQMMGIPPKEFIRRHEQAFKELGLKDKLEDAASLFKAMTNHPKLMERPIIVKGKRAILGRPPERVLELL